MELRERGVRAGDSLTDDMNRSQTGHQNESGDVNPDEQNERTDLAHGTEEQSFSENETDPTARSLNVERVLPTLQMLRLQLQQTRAGCEKENDPWNPRDDSQP